MKGRVCQADQLSVDRCFPEGNAFVRLTPFPEVFVVNRSLNLAAALIYLILALLPAMSYAQSKTPEPMSTVYKTPT